MRIKMKMNAKEENSPMEPIPEGEYILTCTKAKDGKTSTGRDMTNLELVVADGPYENRKIWHNVTFIPSGEKGHGMCVHACHAFGLPYDGDVDFDTSEFEGKSAKAYVVVETREWQGRTITGNKVLNFGTDDHPIVAPSPKPQPRKEKDVSF